MTGRILRAPITERRKAVFLKRLAETGSMPSAAKAAAPDPGEGRIDYSTWVRLAREDPEFGAAVDTAKAEALAKIEDEIERRAMMAYQRPIVSQGVIVAYEERYDNTLLLRYARALDRSRWGDKVQVEHVDTEGNARVDLSLLSEEERQEVRTLVGRVNEIMAQAEARRQAAGEAVQAALGAGPEPAGVEVSPGVTLMPDENTDG